MKTNRTAILALTFFLGVGMGTAGAATNDVSALLQRGLFEEEANQNLEAAIQAYQGVIAQTEKDRQFAATAIFRLGECYRKEGKTNEANTQYQRILSEFVDQTELARLSRGYLGNGAVAASAARQADRQLLEQKIGLAQQELDREQKLVEAKLVSSEDLVAVQEKLIDLKRQLVALDEGQPAASSGEANLLARQLAGIEKLKSDPEEQARGVAAIFPDDGLKKMLVNLPKLQEQEANQKANPAQVLQNYRVAIDGDGYSDLYPDSRTNHVEFVEAELKKQMSLIQQRVDFIMGIQRARLKVLQGGEGVAVAQNAGSGAPAGVTDEEQNEIQRIQLMIQNSPDLVNSSGPANQSPPLVQAAERDYLRVAQYLLDHQAKPDVRDPHNSRQTALTAAAFWGHKTMVELLLSRGAEVDAKNDLGQTALMLAAMHGFESVTETLLAHKANVSLADQSGGTPLHAAAENGQAAIAKMLLAAGTNPNAEDNSGRTPVSFAAEKGSAETVGILLEAKADPNESRIDQPLLGAIHAKDTGSAELLLKAGANPNAVGTANWEINNDFNNIHSHVTPIFFAVYLKQLPMLKLLLQFKADPNDSQSFGVPLIFNSLDKPEILTALIDAGAKVDAREPNGRTPLLAAAGQNDLEAAKLLLDHKADANAQDDNYNSALGLAVSGRLPDIVKVILAHQPKVDILNKEGRTPLQGAVEQRQVELAGLLLDAGADINVRFEKNDNMSLLTYAAATANRAMVELFLAHKADPNSQDKSGGTPLSWAKRLQSAPNQARVGGEIAELLRNAGANENLQRLSSIGVSRNSANFSQTIFLKGTNSWNQYTLLQLITASYAPPGSGQVTVLPGPAFPDFGRIRISRLQKDGRTNVVKVDMSAVLNSGDCSQDVSLEWGDIVEIPETDHRVDESWTGLTREEGRTLWKCLGGQVAIVVKRQTNVVLLTMRYFHPSERGFDGTSYDIHYPSGFNFMHGTVYNSSYNSTPPVPAGSWSFWLYDVVQGANVILTSSDLSRVKVTRTDAKTGKRTEMIFDLRNNDPANALWLRDGDLIEIPEQQ